MTLPVVPGSSLSFSQVNTELGYSSTAVISLNDTAVRNLAGVGASPAQIAITDLSGKSNVFTFTISSNQTNANLRSLAVSAGWNQSAPVSATLNSSTYIYSTSTGTPGLTIDGSWPGGVTLVNNGFIMGMGGAGRGGSTGSGSSGGTAISLGVNCTITNNSYIGGGGGGGGAYSGCGGGGAGGGAGGDYGAANPAGGAGGGPGSAGSSGGAYGYVYKGTTYYQTSGGGGGRIMPGSGGSAGGGFAGNPGGGGGSGGGGSWGFGSGSVGTAGAGGSAGSGGGYGSDGGGGGGGWGASGGSTRVSGGGGAGGKAIALNGFTVTQNGSGTTYGTVS